MSHELNAKYALPITLPRSVEVLRTIDQQYKHYGFFEVWLDYIEDLDDALLGHLVMLYPGQIIAIFRRRDDAPARLSFERRIALMRELTGRNALLDLDVTLQSRELAELAPERDRIKLIASFHDYEKTPSLAELEEIVRMMEQHSPTVRKISTYCRSEGDAVRLLSLGLSLREQAKEHIVLGMGRHGIPTRIFGTLWGNKMIFAPFDRAQASAPGQLTRQQLESIIREITS